MNVIQAARETLDLALSYNMENCDVGSDYLQFSHLQNMVDEMSDYMDEGKMNRYLGWIQCAVVSFGVALDGDDRPTLEMMKEINRRNQ